jgi:hypothetical protein
MPRLGERTPAYRLHRATGRAVVIDHTIALVKPIISQDQQDWIQKVLKAFEVATDIARDPATLNRLTSRRCTDPSRTAPGVSPGCYGSTSNCTGHRLTCRNTATW